MTDTSVLLGPGDDAALIEPGGTLAVATDTLVENTHFLPSITPQRLGHRALAVNLSDMAAMGARPRWFTLALSLPRVDERWLDGFAAGLHACAARFGVSLVGGDTTSGPLCIGIQMIGEVPQTLALRRAGASDGDAVFVTGTLGDAAAGLGLAGKMAADLEDGDRHGEEGGDMRWLLDRYEVPEPRVGAGLALRGIATSAIDISDGLVADLGWICSASGCGATLDVERLPLSAALLRRHTRTDAAELALTGGDDYELCFTAPADAQSRIEAALGELDVDVTRIGTCMTGAGVVCRLDGEKYVPGRTGYDHFR